MVVFLCIDYTIWPGWNHRGVYLYSRERDFKVGSGRGFSVNTYEFLETSGLVAV